MVACEFVRVTVLTELVSELGEDRSNQDVGDPSLAYLWSVEKSQVLR